MKLNFEKIKPIYWSILIFVIAQVLTFIVVAREDYFLNAHNIYVPTQPPQIISVWPGTVTTTAELTETTTLPSGQTTTNTTTTTGTTEVTGYSSLGPILIYIFSVVIVLGLVLFLVPLSALRIILKALFAFLFSWGIFISVVLWVPLIPTLIIALAIGLIWFFIPRVWFHNLVMVLALVSVGAVFGRLISPWTAMLVIAALAIYDFLAVRFGFMVWMANRLSESTTLPAFVIPHIGSEWNASMRPIGSKIVKVQPAERSYSVLGGGDIGFPLLLISSVYFASGFGPAVIIAAFTLAGLISAYWIQAVFLKGKPMPALPPIAVLSLIGLLLIQFVI